QAAHAAGAPLATPSAAAALAPAHRARSDIARAAPGAGRTRSAGDAADPPLSYSCHAAAPVRNGAASRAVDDVGMKQFIQAARDADRARPQLEAGHATATG